MRRSSGLGRVVCFQASWRLVKSRGDLSQDGFSLLHVLSHFPEGWSGLAHKMMVGLRESNRKCVKYLEAQAQTCTRHSRVAFVPLLLLLPQSNHCPDFHDNYFLAFPFTIPTYTCVPEQYSLVFPDVCTLYKWNSAVYICCLAYLASYYYYLCEIHL